MNHSDTNKKSPVVRHRACAQGPEPGCPDLSGMPELLTKDEVAKFLRVSVSSVNRLIASRELVALHTTKRKVVITKSSVMELCSHPFNL